MFKVTPERDGGKEAFRFPHRAKRRMGIDLSGAAPFEEVRNQSVEPGVQEGERLCDLFTAVKSPYLAERLIQEIRRRNTGQCPDVPQMCAEQPVEFLLVRRIEVVAIPPKPVTALSCIEFVPGRLRSIRRQGRGQLQQAGSCMVEEVPSPVVFLMA